MSIQQNFPGITPTLSLNFARSKKLDPRITFTRTSSATRINETGLVEVVPANAPRFDHSYDPVSGSVRSLGLLVEEQRTNVALQSENLDFGDSGSSTGWYGVTRASIIPNDTLSPNNTLTADKIVANTDNNSHNVSNRTQNETTNNANPITISVYFKPAGETKAWLYFTEASTYSRTITSYYDLTGNGSTVTPTVGNGASGATSSIIALPNGWYRCILTGTLGGTDTRVEVRLGPSQSTTTNIYTGNNVDGIYAWGLQVEQGSFPTSYIPTTNTTVTRTADFARIEGKNFQDFFNPSEGTTIIQIQNYNISNTSTSLLSYSGTTVPNNSMNYFRQLDSQPVGQIIFNGTLPMNIGLGAVWTDSSLQKHAFFYQKDNSGIANRSLVSLDTSVDIPVVERMIIGSTTQGNNKFTLSQLTYYPKRLTNSQLQNLTR